MLDRTASTIWRRFPVPAVLRSTPRCTLSRLLSLFSPCAAYVVLLALVCVNYASAIDFVVSTTADSGAGSLRQAIQDLNAAGPGTHSISLSNGLGVIELGDNLPPILGTGQTITIAGNANTIDGQSQSAIFFVGGGTVAINNLTLQNGNAVGGEGGNGLTGGGGGLGAGGALFVNSGANVEIVGVEFKDKF